MNFEEYRSTYMGWHLIDWLEWKQEISPQYAEKLKEAYKSANQNHILQLWVEYITYKLDKLESEINP